MEEAPRRLGDDDLAAVRGGCDPRRAVHVHADVAVRRHERLTGVDTHSDPDRPTFELPLRIARGGGGVGRSRKGDEEGITLGVDLDAVVSPEGLADRTPVLVQETRVGGAVLLKQARRPLDVGEEERDRAGWQWSCAHRAIISHRSWKSEALGNGGGPAQREQRALRTLPAWRRAPRNTTPS